MKFECCTRYSASSVLALLFNCCLAVLVMVIGIRYLQGFHQHSSVNKFLIDQCLVDTHSQFY